MKNNALREKVGRPDHVAVTMVEQRRRSGRLRRRAEEVEENEWIERFGANGQRRRR
jgi:hypothetical protein